MKKIKLGNGFDVDIEMGLVILIEYCNKIEFYMDVVKVEGVIIVVGGKCLDRDDLKDGLFFELIVIINCDMLMCIV